MSRDELELINLTVQKFVRPQFVLDKLLLDKVALSLRVEKLAQLDRLGVTRAELLSDSSFARLLKQAAPDVRLPKKQGKRGVGYAFAKTDAGMQALALDPRLTDLVAARISAESTQETTRVNRFRGASLSSQLFPVPLVYYGAHTGRFSGGDKLNVQNMGRKSVLRAALVAPPLHKVIAADLSQIEARLVATVAQQWDLVDEFAAGVDVYSSFAGDHYGYPIHKDTHPTERFVGKTGILSLGFQSGANKFHDTMNFTFNTPISLDEAQRVVATYRRKYSKIVDLWGRMDDAITAMSRGQSMRIGPLETARNKIVLPNGMPMFYPELSRADGEWRYMSRTGWKKLYAGALTENCIQALARIVITTAELRLTRIASLRAALSVHDELVYVVEAKNARLYSGVVKAFMEKKVAWLPELPVACEVTIGDNYGECK